MKTESPKADNPSSVSVRGRLLLDGRMTLGVVIVKDGRIAEVRTGDLDSNIPPPVRNAHMVSPGLIDLQMNGGFGHEVGGNADALAGLAARVPETGVTSFLPTLTSGSAADYRAAAAALLATATAPGARRLGLHLEGPLLSPARVGAHDPKAVAAAQGSLDDVLEELIAADAVRVITVAPERPGALALIRRLRDTEVVVSL